MQIDELSSRDSSLVEELANLGESRISLGTERENIVVELDNLKIESEEITERRNEVKAMQQARELDAAKSQARSQALRDNFDQLESQISRIESSLARKREEYALAEEEIEASKVTEQQSIQEIETYVYEKDAIDEELVVRRERNSEVIDKLKEQEKELKLAREKQSSIQGAKSKLTVEKEKSSKRNR